MPEFLSRLGCAKMLAGMNSPVANAAAKKHGATHKNVAMQCRYRNVRVLDERDGFFTKVARRKGWKL
ncbi:hypothetical protein MES4922_220060 [Mesorhizobium ventifaucium]|uniref:Uncharacterized protein n=1 Tax=Mesorhizobium ventifaucium TaxID=666020 RepID=A0ABM9DUF0_9HYPH|nr:hypothetical protein MES4922_220060 [Mesorhizobium ventifaucium]